MSQADPEPKVSIEDLLRIKRAEQPGPEFWVNFERELRQKQLTALVQKRRWWHELHVMFNRRIYLPVGAAAIVALAMVSVRYAVPTRLAQGTGSTQESALADNTVAEVLAVTEVPASALVESTRHEELIAGASIANPGVPVTKDTLAAGLSTPAFRETETPATRATVASLTRLTQTEPRLLEPLLDNRLNDPIRAQLASVAQSEVAAMTTASSSKYRLIARYADRSLSPAPTPPAVVKERLARRLGDDLNDDISRIGVVGSRVSLKF